MLYSFWHFSVIRAQLLEEQSIQYRVELLSPQPQVSAPLFPSPSLHFFTVLQGFFYLTARTKILEACIFPFQVMLSQKRKASTNAKYFLWYQYALHFQPLLTKHTCTVNVVSRKVEGSLEKGMLAGIDGSGTKQIRTEVKKYQKRVVRNLFSMKRAEFKLRSVAVMSSIADDLLCLNSKELTYFMS